jgi:hypothetical protein
MAGGSISGNYADAALGVPVGAFARQQLGLTHARSGRGENV